MNTPVRVAVIGAGQIAQRGHLPGLLAAGASLTAICDNNHPQLDEIAARFHIQHSYRNWREMLAAGGFDAVTICTPPFLHADMAVECLQRGYHVLVEKPMAVTLQQCDQMNDAVKPAGLILMISHNQRFMEPHRLAKDILDSGILGRPYLVHGVFGHSGPEVWSPTQEWYFRPERAGLGVMADLGYHKLDLVRWMTNQEVTQASAFGHTFEKATSLEDTAIFALKLSRGTLYTLQISWVFRPDWENSLVIRCERGVLTIPTESSEPVRVLYTTSPGVTVESAHHCNTSDTSGWFGAMRAFVSAVQAGTDSPIPDSEGRAAMAAILAAAQSIKQQTVITVS